MQKLNDEVLRKRALSLNLIKKLTVSRLIRTGESQFEAIQQLEKLNDFYFNCHKCGSTLKCTSCLDEIKLR